MTQRLMSQDIGHDLSVLLPFAGHLSDDDAQSLATAFRIELLERDVSCLKQLVACLG